MDGVAALGDAIEILAGDDLSLLSDSFLSDELAELQRLRTQLDAEVLRRQGEWDSRTAWAHDGALSGAGWLKRRCRVRLSAARAELRLAGQLRTAMPRTAEALGAGEITADHARILARAQTRAPDAFPDAEEMLVGHARQLCPEQLTLAVRHWVNHVDPDGSLADHRDGHEGRGANVSKTIGNTTVVDGTWHGDQGDLVARAIDAYYELEWRADQALPEDQRRTPRQLRADAIAALAQVGLDHLAGETRSRRARPHIRIVIRAHQLFGDTFDDGTTPGDLLDRLDCSTLPRQALRRLCCDSEIGRAIVDADGHVLDLGRSVRTVTDHQFTALALRDHGCAFPGCNRPPEWCDGHHIHHWDHGGPTDMWNGLLLCKRHHTLVHEGGYTLRHTAGPAIEFRRPDGTLLEHRPWIRPGGGGGGGGGPPP